MKDLGVFDRLTVLKGDEVEEFTINILKINTDTKTKNISDNWLIYLRSYSTSYVWENITISNNKSIL